MTTGRLRHPAQVGLSIALLASALILLAGCGPAVTRFEGSKALRHVETLCGYGERPVGSEANARAAQYIGDTLSQLGWDVAYDRFAYSGQDLTNVIAKRGSGPLIILGTHFDTRPLADRDPSDRSVPVMGANDGGSGTAVLLELARVLDPEATETAEIWLVFFDGEDRGEMDGWPWCVGSQHMADNLVAEGKYRPEYVLIVDMIGDADQQIYYEWSSSLWLQEKVWGIAREQGYAAQFVPEHRYRILDDHSPFLAWSIPAAVIIDFDYPYWHTRADTVDKISADNLQRVGDVLEHLLEDEPFSTHVSSSQDQ